MSLTNERRYHVICDNCGEDYYDPDSNSAMGARITAGIKGWQYLQRKTFTDHGIRQQRVYDFCPSCEPKLPG